MTAHSPIETVLVAYSQLREPEADVLANVISDHALQEYKHSMLSRMTRALHSPDDSASHGIPLSVRNADRAWLSALSPADFLQFVVAHVPVEKRQLDVQVVGTVDEGPDRTWVLIRTDCAAESSSGVVISAEEFDAFGERVEHDPQQPTLVETRRVGGTWVVWALGTTTLALPGTSGWAF